jgi:hypothetical protein
MLLHIFGFFFFFFFKKEGRRILGRLWEFFLGFRCNFFFTVSLYDEVAIISDIVIIFSLTLCQQSEVIAVTIASEHGTHISPK